LARLTEGGEGLEDFLNAGSAGRLETRCNLLWRLEWRRTERIFDDTELFGERRWPGLLAPHGGRSFNGDEATERLLYGRSVGCLELRAKPADHAGCLFGPALGVEGHDVCENLLGAQASGPPVCGEDGLIQLVMNLINASNQAHLVYTMILDRQFLVDPELFQDVVHFCERECGVKLLLALAVRIKALGHFANNRL